LRSWKEYFVDFWVLSITSFVYSSYDRFPSFCLMVMCKIWRVSITSLIQSNE
jgi:hypothetical protein